MKKIALLLIIPTLVLGLVVPAASAEVNPGVKSLLIPGWGQYENGDFKTTEGKMKVGVMAAVELAAILTTSIVGGVTGYPQIWVGIGLFIGNHVWSALDAAVNANREPAVQLGTQPPAEKIGLSR